MKSATKPPSARRWKAGRPYRQAGILEAAAQAAASAPRGLSDHNTLDINRIRYMVGAIETKDDYTLLAQLALQLGNAAEAQSYIEKGMAAKVLNDDRSNRLLALAKTQAAANAANQAKLLAAAQAAPQGDDLVKVGENMIGQGKAKDAIADHPGRPQEAAEGRGQWPDPPGPCLSGRRPEGRRHQGHLHQGQDPGRRTPPSPICGRWSPRR